MKEGIRFGINSIHINDNNNEISMNKEQFIELIYNKIGYTVQRSHNGLNDKLVTHNGTVTDIRVCEDHLEPYSNHLYGGESFNIQAKWDFKNKDSVVYSEELKCVSVDGLLLMNHDLAANK